MALKVTVLTSHVDEPVFGSQFAVITTPPELYVDGVIDTANGVYRFLREASEMTATAAGQVLHHADWVITRDPEVVLEAGGCGHAHCSSCTFGMDQVLAHLRDNGEELAVGTLYWVR